MNGERAWQSLAELYNLIYIPQHQWQKARVAGRYRGYQLHLSSYLFGLEIILTATSPLPQPPASPFTEGEITPLFLNPYLSNLLDGYFRAQDRGQRFFYHQVKVSSRTDLQGLQQLLNRLCDLADSYRQLLAWEGEVIPLLTQRLVLYPKISTLIHQLLQDIAEVTREKLAQRITSLICPDCLWRGAAQPVVVPDRIDDLGITYYGCRRCGQSYDLVACRQLICLLDETMILPYTADQGIWRVNWLSHREQFDFERVELIRAAEVEVEKFAVQVANNTDPQQKAAYRRMICQIGPECHLSPNTLKLLGRLFGRVSLAP